MVSKVGKVDKISEASEANQVDEARCCSVDKIIAEVDEVKGEGETDGVDVIGSR